MITTVQDKAIIGLETTEFSREKGSASRRRNRWSIITVYVCQTESS